jgi:hypothetical protein
MTDMEQRRQVSDQRRWGAIRDFYMPRKAADVVEGHLGLYDFAASYMGSDTPILYLEFGVAHGTSMQAIAARFRSPLTRFVGFDSFRGLPEAWLMHERGRCWLVSEHGTRAHQDDRGARGSGVGSL